MGSKKTPIERKFISVSKTAADTDEAVKSKAESVADKSAQKAAAKDGGGKTPKGRATGMRIISVVLWLVAIVFEVLVISLLNGMLYIPGNEIMWLIIGIALDLICVIIGSLLWKKANRIDPASEKNKVKFFLWNNMGVIASVLAFLPLIIILLTNKNLNAKTKKIVSIVAAIALVAAIGFSFDYNPVSSEDLAQAKGDAAIQGVQTVYWTQWGRSYHYDPDCHTLMNSANVYQGTIEQAFEANRTDPCDFCAGGKEAKAVETKTEESTE